MDRIRLADYTGYSVYEDVVTMGMCVENPKGVVCGLIPYSKVISLSTAEYEGELRQIIERDIAMTNGQPVDEFYGGFPVEKLKRTQTYLANTSNPSDTSILEREWFIGVGANCVGCLGMDKPNIDHLRSKFHASLRLETPRNSLDLIIQTSYAWAIDQLREAAPPLPPMPASPFPVTDKPTPVECWRGYKLNLDHRTGEIRLQGGNNHLWQSNKLHGNCHGNRQQMIDHILWGTHHPTKTFDAPNANAIGTAWTSKAYNHQASYITPSEEPVYRETMMPKEDLRYKTCRCGIYAFETLDKLYDDAGAEFAAYVRGMAWGTVLLDVKNNVRASDLTFTEIWLNRNMATELLLGDHLHEEWFNWSKLVHYLADFYQVPVVMAEDYEEIKKLREYQEQGMDYMLELNRTWPNEANAPKNVEDDNEVNLY